MERTLENVYIAGNTVERFDIEIENGIFSSIRKTARQEDEAKLWIAPGLTDLHLHSGWTDFLQEEQQKRSPEEVEHRISEGISFLLKMGITTVRDAGGISPERLTAIAQKGGPFPEVFPCAGMLGAETCSNIREIDTVLSQKAGWVKIFATGGIGACRDGVLDPLISEKQFAEMIRKIHAAGKKAMIHTWGGKSLDWAIREGADSVEHCIYMTREQAGTLAEKQTAYIPTAGIYRILADKDGPLELPGEFRERAKRACQAHQLAVKYARESGVKIGLGTDFFADPELLDYELEEIFVLKDYGLSSGEVWRSGTERGAEILGISGTHGKIAEGYTADAVLYSRNPYAAGNADALKKSIVQVLHEGRPCLESHKSQ